jgi:glycerol kinase
MTHVAALDQGTTGTRAMVFDADGGVAGEAYATHEQHYPEPGWVEHDPEEILENAVATLRRAVEAAGVDAVDLAALGLANQRETTVVWEAATGDPVGNAVVWQDRRTTGRVEELVAAGRAPEIRRRTGLEPDAYFSATKVEWILDERGENLRERARAGELRFGTVDAWLLDRLAGVHATDVTNASRTMLFDVHDLSWDDELLAEFGVPRAMLPEVRPSVPAEPFGHLDEEVLGAPVPVAGVLGDQQAALFGQTCFEPGETKATTGTGSFVLMATGEAAVESDHGLLTTVAFQAAGEPARYALEGSVFTTGAAVEWLVDLGVAESPADVEALAAEADDHDVHLVPAFSGLGAPHWDERARGTVVGMSRDTGPEELASATLWGVAHRVREVVDAMAADAGAAVDVLRVDGGAAGNDGLCRRQADLLGTPVERPAVTETTALGAACAAGLSVGVWADRSELREHRRVERRFDPGEERAAERRHERWSAALERSRGWADED